MASGIDWGRDDPKPDATPAKETSGVNWDDVDTQSRPLKPGKPIAGPSDYEYTPARDVGSFTEGFRAQLAAFPSAAARLAGVGGAEQTAKFLGSELDKLRETPMGELGSTAANFATGVAVPGFGGKLLASTLLGGGVEAAQRFGEGKDALDGFVSGAAGTALANRAVKLGAKLANAGSKAVGATGRWENPSEEYISDFARSKGVDLRLGDLPGHPVAKSVENVHVGAVGTSGLERQAAQLEGALFGGGKNSLFDGFGVANQAIKDESIAAWKTVNQLASQGTTRVPPLDFRSTLSNELDSYPKLASKIRNAKTQGLLDDLLTGSPMKNFSFAEMRQMQQDLGEQVALLHRRGKIGDKERAAADRVYASISRDLENWGQHPRNQTAYDAYKTTNDWYKKEILPFEQNDILSKWRDGDYTGHNEALIRDIINPANKTQVEQLRWYLSKVGHPAAHDATGLLEVLSRANRAAAVLAKGAPEPSMPSSMLSVPLTVARATAGKTAGGPWLTAIGGAAPTPNVNQYLGKVGKLVDPDRRIVGGLSAMGGLYGTGWSDVRGQPQ